MLSFKSGQAVAEVVFKDKKLKSKPIYVKDDDGSKNEMLSVNKDEILPKSFYTGLKNMGTTQLALLKKAIRENKIGYLANSRNLMEAFSQAQVLLSDIGKQNFLIPKSEGDVKPVPLQESSRMAVFGPAGVGKSTFISNWLKTYKEKYPKNHIYIFSPKLDDPAFKKIKDLDYVKLDDTVLSNVLNVSEFIDSCCVFDDIESITNKALNEAIRRFRDQCYEIGRAPTNITTIAVHHVILANQATKIILNESEEVVLFPKSNFSAVSNLCRRYYGFDKDQLNYLKSVPSRWVVIKRSYPTCIISENAVKVI
ncbi:MAG: hypothetical protein JSS98_04290 [Bacteroidetes bacterium]|nr:hypothetical protein [Bacteroidota bacterium]